MGARVALSYSVHFDGIVVHHSRSRSDRLLSRTEPDHDSCVQLYNHMDEHQELLAITIYRAQH